MKIDKIIAYYQEKKSVAENQKESKYYNSFDWFKAWVDSDIKIFSEFIDTLKILSEETRK